MTALLLPSYFLFSYFLNSLISLFPYSWRLFHSLCGFDELILASSTDDSNFGPDDSRFC